MGVASSGGGKLWMLFVMGAVATTAAVAASLVLQTDEGKQKEEEEEEEIILTQEKDALFDDTTPATTDSADTTTTTAAAAAAANAPTATLVEEKDVAPSSSSSSLPTSSSSTSPASSQEVVVVAVPVASALPQAVALEAGSELSGNDTPKKQVAFEDTVMAKTKEAFKRAVRQVASIPKADVSQEDKLRLYGLYKQATEGDRDDRNQPFILDFMGRAKYDAWRSCGGKSTLTAMTEYVKVAESVAGKDENADIVYDDDQAYQGEAENDDDDGVVAGASKSSGFSGMGMKQSTPLPIVVDSPNSDSSSSKAAFRRLAHSGDLAGLQKILKEAQSSSSSPPVFDQADESGQTPLHFAADGGSLDCVKALVEAGANVNAVDGEGISVLHAAVISGHVPVASYLLEHGADPDTEDVDGETPRSSAQGEGTMVMVELFGKY